MDIFLINTSDKLNYKVTNPYALFFFLFLINYYFFCYFIIIIF